VLIHATLSMGNWVDAQFGRRALRRRERRVNLSSSHILFPKPQT
jgi:hypothetical protein